MLRVTITLEEETERWLRIRAAEREISLSQLVGELLRELRISEQRANEKAEEQFFAIEPRPLGPPGARYPRRDELEEERARRR